MDEYLKQLNLVDLLSEKHRKLRDEVMQAWSDKSGQEITNSETHLLALVETKSMSMAECARRIHISRQAMHKCAKKLEERGYLRMSVMEGNNRDKAMFLTSKGEQYCLEMHEIKAQIEREIALHIGAEAVELLKKLLRRDWLDK